jgi:hypothetical protein
VQENILLAQMFGYNIKVSKGLLGEVIFTVLMCKLLGAQENILQDKIKLNLFIQHSHLTTIAWIIQAWRPRWFA